MQPQIKNSFDVESLKNITIHILKVCAATAVVMGITYLQTQSFGNYDVLAIPLLSSLLTVVQQYKQGIDN